MIGAFAAVGALLIAGMQLKDLGKLDGLDAYLAAIGAGLGIVGVVIVLVASAAVLAAGRVPMTDLVGDSPRRKDLQEALERSPNLFQPFTNLSAFHEELSKQWKAAAEAWIEYEKPGVSDSEKAEAEKRFGRAGRFVRQFNPLNRRILATAEYENVRRRWDTLRRWWIGPGVAITAIGAGLFAYTSPSADEEPEAALPAAPARGYLHLNEEGREEFAPLLGKDCDVKNLPVIALSHTEGAYELVSDPDDDACKVIRLDVSDEEGEVTGAPLPPFKVQGG